MFKLVKFVNGRINTSEPRFITLTTAISADQGGDKADKGVFVGSVVNITSGVLTKLSNTSGLKPTHIVWRKPLSGDKEVWVIDLTPDMVFECPLSAAVAAGLGAYTETYISANGDGVTGAAVTTVQSGTQPIGAILYDTIPAGAAQGDLVRVFFKAL